jgi:hypothetical protein
MMVHARLKSDGRQPEALASLAETARNGGERPDALDDPDSAAGEAIAADPDAKADAAARVLRRGTTGREGGADDAVGALPDRAEPRGRTAR